MLQNRVDPFGNIIKTNARGAWMGNRGLLHDENQNLRRPFRLKAWITCVLQFKERKRIVMAPKRYTELFFFDEATSFAAGHRPCAECRRSDFNRFKSVWLKANPQYGFNEKVPIQEIDQILHEERLNSDGSKKSHKASVFDLPNGCFIALNQRPYLVLNGLIFQWSPFGYQKGEVFPDLETVDVLTPRSIVNSFLAGYVPQIAIESLLSDPE